MRLAPSVAVSLAFGLFTFLACRAVQGDDRPVPPEVAASIRGGICYAEDDCPDTMPACVVRCSNIYGCTMPVTRKPLKYVEVGKKVESIMCADEPNCKFSVVNRIDCSTTDVADVTAVSP